MTKEELLQFSKIKIEIELLKEQIEKAEYQVMCNTVSDVVAASSTAFPYTKYSAMVTGIDYNGYVGKVERLKKKYKARLKKLIKEAEKVNRFIDSIEDSEMRMIIALKYINGLTWKQIAISLGVEGDGSTERKKHNKFLNVSSNSPKTCDNIMMSKVANLH